MTQRISQSRIKSYRTCRQQHHFKYNERLQRKRVRRSLQFGRIIHKMIEEDAAGNDAFDVLKQLEKDHGPMFRAEREEYGDILRDVRYIMTDYFNYWDEEGAVEYVKHQGKYAEHKFEVEIEKGLTVTGIMDVIVKYKSLVWLGEHKSFTREPKEDHRWRNLQSSIYLRIAEIMGWPNMDGVMWNYVRSKPPTAPKLLKSKQMSERQTDTLPSKVVHTLRELNLPVRENKRLIDQARQNRSRYFIRHFSPASRITTDIIYGDFVATAREIAEDRNKSTLRTIGLHCDNCDFEPICRAVLQGLDVDFVKEREYEVRKNSEEDSGQPPSKGRRKNK